MQRKKLRNVLILVGINIFILLLLDFLCGLIVPPDRSAINFESYPDYVYRMPPNKEWTGGVFPPEVTPEGFSVTYGTNSHGFRGSEFIREKAPGKVRVLCMGDSHTFGEGVPQSQIFASQLEHILNQAAGEGRFEVINLGVSGYSSYQGLLLLEKEALAFSPDYVVVGYGSNDYFTQQLGPYRDLTDREVIALLNRSNKLPSRLMGWVKGTHLYHGLKKGILGTWSKIHGLFSDAGERRRVPVEEYRGNLARFRDISEKEGFEVIYMNIANYRNLYSRTMAEVAREEGTGFLNAVEAFRKRLPAIRTGGLYAPLLAPYREMLGEKIDAEFYDPGAMYYTVDGAHPNAVGHRIIAEELARKVLAHEGIRPAPGILPPPP